MIVQIESSLLFHDNWDPPNRTLSKEQVKEEEI
jgi:hypothetical protein